jgi:hypothetical protein
MVDLLLILVFVLINFALNIFQGFSYYFNNIVLVLTILLVYQTLKLLDYK